MPAFRKNQKDTISLNALNDVFKTISDCENEMVDVASLLDGPICHSGFQRLN